jgi:hypothetical protein
MSSKVCSKCKEEKLAEEFYKDSSKKDCLNIICKECSSKQCSAYRAANSFKLKDNKLRRSYGISLVDYLEMLEAQNGRCKICKTDVPGGAGSFHVDHCHSSNKVRGLLCHHCNVGIGNFKDNISTLASAILYLSEHQ